jgi:asparagine synthase (glutamine-hydrolysing)
MLSARVVSGIVGIVNLDRAPVDPVLLRAMTQDMTFRGPDAQESWANSHVGLGHTMLRTTFQMMKEQQPRTLDGQVWITADARIDAREELIHELEVKGWGSLSGATDTDLILYAYRAWDTNCVHHLLGDFVFAIWDAPRQRLFCARDHFGVRPFYYAEVGGCLIFSNNLDTIRRHPRVSDELNDLAIVNFLLFRYQTRADQTSFADIQSLLPSHSLMWDGRKVSVWRYWTLPIEEPIRYNRRLDYVDHFRELLDRAVADRTRTDRAGVLMSGGMDSSSIAATIHSLGRQGHRKVALKAFTWVYDRLIPDEERRYAQMVSDYLGLPIHFRVLDNEKWLDGWDREEFRFPEPIVNTPLWSDEDPVRKAALNDDCRVFYIGWGPDVMMSEPMHLLTLLRQGRIGNLISQTGSFLARHRKRPLGGARRLWQRLWGTDLERRGYRSDINALALLTPSIAKRIRIPDTWWQFGDPPETHPWRPSCYSHLTDYYWTLGFQQNDAANWRAPVEFRYPYFDKRLVQYLLRVPAIPEFSDKRLLRDSMRGRLPPEICTRAKAPLAGEPKHRYADWVHCKHNVFGDDLGRYLDIAGVIGLRPEADQEAALIQRVIALNHWLESYRCRSYVGTK